MNKIKDDEVTVQKIEDWLQKQVVKLVENNHSKIGKLVQENLDKLDDKTLIEMIENNVGKDLQWIRSKRSCLRIYDWLSVRGN